ncbi:MAG: phosphoglycerate kinase [Actinobacteria bacterium]|nr:MAG: phosphoglycerate kinase [Actinomycetota bacterium]
MRTLEDLGDLSTKRVLVRCDFNVPLEGGRITDDMRIRAALPTIDELRKAGASLILCSHLGRPKGKPDPRFSVRPVGSRLSELLDTDVVTCGAVIGGEVRQCRDRLEPGDVMLLENLRFDPRFGAAHRAHASVVGVAELLPSAAGRLVQKEIEVLTRLRDSAAEPFVAILGGVKVSDKLAAIDALIERVDALLIGGAMAFSFLAAAGAEVGRSLVERERFYEVRAAVRKADERGVVIQLPEDVVAAPEPSVDAPRRTVPAREIPRDLMGLDIGPRSVEEFARTIADAATIFWNGPMGVFELEPFSAGTRGVATAVSAAPGYSVVGGGDSLAALRKFDLADGVDHLSTGGGASLEFLEGKELPGVAVLMEDTA